jgi:formylglycine-generating enzyme required for sulfatase activity
MKRTFLIILTLAALVSCAPASRYSLPSSATDIHGMVFVQGGCFKMGDRFKEGIKDERPVHKVCLNGFYIDTHEVTKNDMGTTGACPDCPRTRISWHESRSYCESRGKRLPTEAEWEYAASSGGRKLMYPGERSDPGLYSFYDENSGGSIKRVGLKEPNLLGIYDMGGNAWEWVSDWYSRDYYAHSPVDNPQGPASGKSRVWRGGAWEEIAWLTRISARYQASPEHRAQSTGFRCAKNP